jgi:hypothetical protein
VGTEQLLQEVVVYFFVPFDVDSFLVKSLVLLDFASTKAEAFLSPPQAIHEFIVSRVTGDC